MKNNTYKSACSTLYDKFLAYIVFDPAYCSFSVDSISGWQIPENNKLCILRSHNIRNFISPTENFIMKLRIDN